VEIDLAAKRIDVDSGNAISIAMLIEKLPGIVNAGLGDINIAVRRSITANVDINPLLTVVMRRHIALALNTHDWRLWGRKAKSMSANSDPRRLRG
jgi:hypothetical protein